jgi:hypothetical protein
VELVEAAITNPTWGNEPAEEKALDALVAVLGFLKG